MGLAEPYPDAGRHLGRRGGYLPPDVRILVHAWQVTARRKGCQPAALDHDGNGASYVDDDGTRLLHSRLPHTGGRYGNGPRRCSPLLQRLDGGEGRERTPAVPADDLQHRHLAGLLARRQRSRLRAAAASRVVAAGSRIGTRVIVGQGSDHRDEQPTIGQRDQHGMLAARSLGVSGQCGGDCRIRGTVIVAESRVSRPQVDHSANNTGGLQRHPPMAGAPAAFSSATGLPRLAG